MATNCADRHPIDRNLYLAGNRYSCCPNTQVVHSTEVKGGCYIGYNSNNGWEVVLYRGYTVDSKSMRVFLNYSLRYDSVVHYKAVHFLPVLDSYTVT